MATVCGFEVYINNKHIIGRVKEKEEAQREYMEAISSGKSDTITIGYDRNIFQLDVYILSVSILDLIGKGAYLLEEEEADLFVTSIGNIPPRAIIVIKVRYNCPPIHCILIFSRYFFLSIYSLSM